MNDVQKPPRTGGERACRDAMAVLAAGRGQTPESAWTAAEAHAAGCAACRERLGLFAGAVLVTDADEIPCAECQARLPAYLTAASGATADTAVRARVAAHLSVCDRCRAVADLVAPTLSAAAWSALPEPAQYPRFDTSFLARQEPERVPALVSLRAALARRFQPPVDGRRAESPLSVGVLGLALMVLVVLVGLAGAWALFAPGRMPQPVAPRGVTATPRVTAMTPTATPTPTAGAAGGRLVVTVTPVAPAHETATRASAVGTTPAPAEPTERLRRPTVAQPDGGSPAPIATEGTPDGYPPPYVTDGPTEDPYPGGVTPEPTAGATP